MNNYKKENKFIGLGVFPYKFSEEQIIEWSRRPIVKKIDDKFLQVGDLVYYNFRLYGNNINEYGFVTRIYHTVFHHHKRIKVLFYLRFYGKLYRTFDEKGDEL